MIQAKHSMTGRPLSEAETEAFLAKRKKGQDTKEEETEPVPAFSSVVVEAKFENYIPAQKYPPSAINDQIFIGTIRDAQDDDLLKEYKIGNIVLVGAEFQDLAKQINVSLQSDPSDPACLCLAWRRSVPFPLEDAKPLADFVNNCNGRVLFADELGVCRGPLAAIVYLASEIPLYDAIRTVHRNHPASHLDDIQVEQLLQLENVSSDS